MLTGPASSRQRSCRSIAVGGRSDVLEIPLAIVRNVLATAPGPHRCTYCARRDIGLRIRMTPRRPTLISSTRAEFMSHDAVRTLVLIAQGRARPLSGGGPRFRYQRERDQGGR